MGLDYLNFFKFGKTKRGLFLLASHLFEKLLVLMLSHFFASFLNQAAHESIFQIVDSIFYSGGDKK